MSTETDTASEEEPDSSTSCEVEIDNQVLGCRKTITVNKSRTQTICELLAAYSHVDAETGELVPLDDDPLAEQPYATCLYFLMEEDKIVLRIYATGDLETAKTAIAKRIAAGKML